VRLPLSADVMRVVLPILWILLALPSAAETWQARDVAAAERYRALERERAERYRAEVEEKAGVRPERGRVGEIVVGKAEDLGEGLASWLGDWVAAELDALLGRDEDAPRRDLGPDDEPHGLREWIARERARARAQLDRDADARER